LKAVFGEGDQPTHDDNDEKRSVAVLQVTVPGNGHKDVGTDKKQDGSHGSRIVSLEAAKKT
jgi:hypothetical protein